MVRLLSVDSTSVRPHQHAAGASGVRRAESNHRNPPGEPDDHTLGCSSGDLTTKIHALIDTLCRPVALLLSPRGAGDNPMLEPLLTGHRLYDRRPFRLLADKAYSHSLSRRLLRALGILHTIRERNDQINRRQAKGSLGGGPQTSTPICAKTATPSNAVSNT
jgi:putative transposase